MARDQQQVGPPSGGPAQRWARPAVGPPSGGPAQRWARPAVGGSLSACTAGSGPAKTCRLAVTASCGPAANLPPAEERIQAASAGQASADPFDQGDVVLRRIRDRTDSPERRCPGMFSTADRNGSAAQNGSSARPFGP
jgi:hypothetical protein